MIFFKKNDYSFHFFKIKKGFRIEYDPTQPALYEVSSRKGTCKAEQTPSLVRTFEFKFKTLKFNLIQMSLKIYYRMHHF